MKQINWMKNVLPHVIAVLVFLIVTLVFFRPAFFDNKTLSQHDILQWEGGANELNKFREATGEEGLWTNSMFGGMPAYLINVHWSNTPIKLVYQLLYLNLTRPYGIILLAFVAFYILLLTFKVRPMLAMGGALAFGLSSFMIIGIGAGHNARIAAIALLPLVVAGVHLMYQNKKWLGFGLTALALAMQLRVNHLQITYYLLIILLVYGLIVMIEAIRQKAAMEFFKKTSLLVVAAILALGTFIGAFWATYEYGKYSIRGKSELTSTNQNDSGKDGLDKEYAFQYSNGIVEPFTLFIPNILGGGSSNYLVQDTESATYKALTKNPQQANQLARYTSAYWGQQPLTAPYYAGALVILLFAIGVAFADKKYVWWLVSISVIGIVLSWGKNFPGFNNFMFDYFPGYNKFRSVTFAILFPLFAMNLLGFIGLEKLLNQGLNKSTQKKALIALGSIAGVAFILLLTGGFGSFKSPLDEQLPVWLVSAMKEDRIGLLRADALRALIFILLGATLIFLVLKSKLSQAIAWPLFALLIVIDLWNVDNRVFGENNYGRSPKKEFFAANGADLEIKKDKSHYRVFNLINPWNDARTSYHHQSLGGYHGAKMRRYQDLIERHLTPEMQQLIDSLRGQSFDFSGLGVVNMLNAQYFVAGPEKNAVIPNRSSNGAAWLVKNIELVSSADDELKSVGEIETKSTAVVNTNKFDFIQQEYDASGIIRLEEYKPNYLKYSVNANQNAFAVFSEIYYPKGWTATIDGATAEIVQTNYVLRGLEVPQGEHIIEFKFMPRAYSVGDNIMLVSSILVLLLFGGSLFMTLKK